jgi:molecular chaperone DnaK
MNLIMATDYPATALLSVLSSVPFVSLFAVLLAVTVTQLLQSRRSGSDAEDKKKKDEIEVKNTADHIIYSAEKAVKDNKDKVDASIVSGVEEKIATLKTAKDTTPADLEAIKKATEELSTEMSKIGEAMSKAGAQGAQSGDASGATGADANDTGATDASGPEGDAKVRDAETK